jgi:hypothetical protein
MAPVYVAITGFYGLGFLLSLGVAGRRLRIEPASANRPSLWRDLAEGLAYVWDTPASLAAMWLAFLVNLTAFPLTSGLLPLLRRISTAWVRPGWGRSSPAPPWARCSAPSR